ncbi:MAG: M23 family metallopeptidase [Bacteroidota bacterium]
MKNYFQLLLIGLLFSFSCHQIQAQEPEYLEITEITLPNGDVDLYGINSAPCPITVYIDFPKIKNYKADAKLPVQSILKKSDEKQFLVKLKRGDPYKDASYGFSYNYGLGDELNAKHNDRQLYVLPYKSGEQYVVSQGYNGKFSHKGMYAIDFQMAVGTPICAARAGVVVEIKENSNRGCKYSKCKGLANSVLIYHKDGTFGYYGHLEYKGVDVEPGQQVKAGEVIGRSGNTGWSSGPHLHFEVHYTKDRRRYTVPITFITGKGKKAELKKGDKYAGYHPTPSKI